MLSRGILTEAPRSRAGDNPTVGLILCAEKDEVVARYSTLHESQQMFGSKYMLYLPTEEELRKELARERDQIAGRHKSLKAGIVFP